MTEETRQDRRKYDELFIKEMARQVMQISTEETRRMFKEELIAILKESKDYTDLRFKTCKACEIFEKDKNVENFFDVTGDYKKLLSHKRDYQWAIALLASSLIACIVKLVQGILK